MSRPWALALVVTVLGAAALRMGAIDYGLPAVYNPDEVAIMSRALAFAKGDLNPHNFLYPTFFFYALFAWLGLYFVIARASGQVASLAQFQQQFFLDPSSVFIAGRALGAVTGALTTAATSLLGRTLFDVPTALAAATLLAVAPLAVQDGHYVKHDVPATLVVTLALWRLARCWPEGGAAGRVSARQLAGAAAVCGVAWSVHYYCVFLAVPLALTVVDRRRREGWRSTMAALALTAVTAMAVFLALSPFLLVEPATAWRDIVANRAIVVDRAVSHGLFGNMQRYLVLLVDGVTLPVVAFAAIGAVRLGVTDLRRAVLLLSFPAPFLLFISNTVPASRYLNPILPIVVLLAGLTIRDLAVRLAPRRAAVMAAVLTVLTASGAFIQSVRTVRFFGQPDSRTLAQAVIESSAPDGATVLVQPYSVQLAQSRASLEESLRARRGAQPRSTRAALRLAVSPWPVPSYRLLWLGDGGLDEDKIYLQYADLGQDPLAVLKAHGVEYVVLKRYNEPDPATRPLADVLARRARLLATISPYRSGVTPEEAAWVEPFLHNTDAIIDPRLQRPGPIVDIFQIR